MSNILEKAPVSNVSAPLSASLPQIVPGTTVFLRPTQIKMPYLSLKSGKRNQIIRRAASMRRYGVLEPLPVIASEEGDEVVYEPAEGEEESFQAAFLAEIDRIPCIILENDGENGEIERIFAQIKQNSLHFLEQAAAFRILVEQYELSQSHIAKRLGISQSAVANKLRLLGLGKEERHRILATGLTERHARAILRLKTSEQRAKTIEKVHREGLTVAATEALIEQILRQRTEDKPQNAQIGAKSNETGAVDLVSPPPDGFRPNKFVLTSLQPLYNSIDRTLAIFQKTGREVSLQREEGPEGVCIIIKIPFHSN